MRNLNQDTITQAVIARFANTPDARLKEIMTSLVQHLHAFAREVKLTEDEWFKGIQFLTDTGHKCDDKRQEFILLSDTLGLSMLTVAMNNDKPEGCTEPTVFGPFFLEDAPKFKLGDDVANGAVGKPCVVRGTIKGLDGKPVPNALINVWQADADGNYDVQYANLAHPQARGILNADGQGNFSLQDHPGRGLPDSTDGPVGLVLKATRNHAWRPAHMPAFHDRGAGLRAASHPCLP